MTSRAGGALQLAIAAAGSLGVAGAQAQAQAAGRLPAPDQRGTVSVEEALVRRRSVRSFTPEALPDNVLGQLLWAAQGVTDRSGFRTAPSAGALYPLELYLVTARGVFHYLPREHALETRLSGDRRRELQRAALDQEAVGQAPAVFVIAAVYDRTAAKYGESRARRYVPLEAGHSAENLLLQAVALELGAVPVGAFQDRVVQTVLHLPAEHEPLYLIPVGRPRR